MGAPGRALTNEVIALAPKDEVLAAGHRYSVVVESPKVEGAQSWEALVGERPYRGSATRS